MRHFGTVLAVVLALVATGQVARADDTPRSITVSTTGEVRLPPDMAVITVGIQTEADTTGAALDQASAAVSGILAAFHDAGVTADDISTGAIRLSPRYSSSALSSGNRIIGYSAVNTVEAHVNDLDILGAVLSAAVGEGANRLDSVRFGLQDPTAAEDDARRRAVEEGRRRATLYAQAAGVELGALRSLSEGGGRGYHMAEEAMFRNVAMSAPQMDVAVAPGEIEVQASVTMVYGIE